MMDDAQLLRRYAQARDEAAFTEFVGRHFNLVYFTALRGTGGNAALAQDIAQAVFAVAARKSRVLAAHATPAGWLHRTTRHITARMLRQERTRQRYEQEAAMHDLINAGAEPEWERLRPVIDDVLDELDARDREAILVRFFQGRPFAEMGETWRISADAARMRVDRALEKLRGALERRGIASVSTALAGILTAQGGLAAPAGLAATVSTAALATTATTGGAVAIFGIMSATKIITGTATAIALLATGSALLQHDRAETAELRLDATTRELTALRARLVRAEQRKSTAEKQAAEADKDISALLATVEAARAGSAPALRATRAPVSPDDPLARTLLPLFPNGVVAALGDRTISVDDVRREITPLLPKLQEMSRDHAEFMQRLYGLQNEVIGGLITRQLQVKEFHNQLDDAPPRQIAPEFVDNAIADQMKTKFNNDPAALTAYLSAQGLTTAQYRQSVEEEIISSYMYSQQRKLRTAGAAKAKPATP